MKRTITIEVAGDANVQVDGIALASLAQLDIVGGQSDQAIRHDTPQETVIAAVIIDAIRRYRQSLGDYSVQLSGSAADMVADAITNVRAAQSGRVDSPQALHDHSIAVAQDNGWTYGPQKSHANKTDPKLVPFNQLTAEQRKESRLVFAIISAMLAVE